VVAGAGAGAGVVVVAAGFALALATLAAFSSLAGRGAIVYGYL
jgi:hypothetical protein